MQKKNQKKIKCFNFSRFWLFFLLFAELCERSFEAVLILLRHVVLRGDVYARHDCAGWSCSMQSRP